MASITIETGLKEIEIVRDGAKVGIIRFDPTDPALLNRRLALRETTKDIHVEPTEDVEKILDESARIDAELRAALDKAFDYPVSDIVFGNSACFTTSNGVSLLEQFLDGIAPIIRDALEAEGKAEEARKKRINKYTAKYQKPDTPDTVKGDE